MKVVDVDGSYLHRKSEHMIASGKEVALLDLPSSPLSGWQEVNKDNSTIILFLIFRVANNTGCWHFPIGKSNTLLNYYYYTTALQVDNILT